MAVEFFIYSDGERHDLGIIRDGDVVDGPDGFEEWVEDERSVPTTPDFKDDDELVNTYNGPHIVAEYTETEEETKELSKEAYSVARRMRESDISYEDIDKCLMRAYDNTVWWGLDEEDPDISKAPDMWKQEDVPKEAVQWIEAAMNSKDVFNESYKGLPHLAPINIERIFRRRLNQGDGFRVNDIVNDLMDTFPSLDENKALGMARDNTGALLDRAREFSHNAEIQEKDSDNEPLYIWDGPYDDSTTDICESVGKITEDRGGVTLDELKKLLREHSNDSIHGTPQYVDKYRPHYQCRRTFKRIE